MTLKSNIILKSSYYNTKPKNI